MKIERLIAFSAILLGLSVLMAWIFPIAGVVLLVMFTIGAIMAFLAYGIMKDDAPEVEASSREHNYRPTAADDDDCPH